MKYSMACSVGPAAVFKLPLQVQLICPGARQPDRQTDSPTACPADWVGRGIGRCKLEFLKIKATSNLRLAESQQLAPHASLASDLLTANFSQ